MMYRLGSEGGDQVRQSIKAIGDAGEDTEKRLQAAALRRAAEVEKAEDQLEAKRRRLDQANEKLQGLGLGGTAELQRIEQRQRQEIVGAQMAREYTVEMERQAAAADRLLASVDPLYAAQLRYNQAVGLADELMAAGAISTQRYAQVLAVEEAALNQVTQAQQRNNVVSGLQRSGYQQLGFQVQDVAQQFALGTPPMIIFAQQGAQVSSALTMIGEGAVASGAKLGAFSRAGLAVASFLSGPYGAAVTGAGLVLASFAGMLEYSTGKEEEAAAAADQHKAAAEALTDAIKALSEAQNFNVQSSEMAVAAARAATQAKLDEAVASRAAAEAELALANARLQSARAEAVGGRAANYGAFGVVGMEEQGVAALEAQISDLSGSILDARESLFYSRVGIARKSIYDFSSSAQKKDRGGAGSAVREVRRDAEEAIIKVNDLYDLLQKIDFVDPTKAANDRADSFYAKLGVNTDQDLDAIVDSIEKARQIDYENRADVIERTTRLQEQRIYELADIYERAFTGAGGNFWDQFKRIGIAVVSQVAARLTAGGGEGDFGSILSSSLRSVIGFNAAGTQYWRGGLTMVGENGAELASLPRGTKIHTAADTRRMLAGNDNGAQQRGLVRVEIDSGDLGARIVAESGPVAAEVVERSSPWLVRNSVAATYASLDRRAVGER